MPILQILVYNKIVVIVPVSEQLCGGEIVKNRQKKLLNILIQNNDFVKIEAIAKLLNVSQRTIHNDLNAIDNYLDNEGVTLIKKPGSGVMIEASMPQKQALLTNLDFSGENTTMLSTKIRRMKILSRLLYRRDSTSLNKLSEEFMVSRTSIVNDFDYLEDYIDKFSLFLVKDNLGTRIEGDESDFRKALSDLASEFLKLEIEDFHIDDSFNSRLDLSTYYRLQNIFDIENLSDIENIIARAEKLLGYKINYLSYVNLVTHLLVLIKRINNDNFIKEEAANLVYDKVDLDIKKTSEYIADEIGTIYDIDIPRGEISYINQYLICSGIQSNLVAFDQDNLFENFDKEIRDLVDKMIAYVSDSISIDLIDDKELRFSLMSHFKPMIQRAKYKLLISNPLLNEIKGQYSALYSVICLSFELIFDKELDSNEDEIGFITVHFQAALERKIGKKNVYVVCPEGIGFSRLIVNRIKRYIPSVNVLGIVAKNQLKNIVFNDVDFIISTTKLDYVDVPVMVVSSLISQYDINAINDYMVKSYDNIDDLELPSLTKIIDKNLVFDNVDLTTKEAVIEFLSLKLYQYGYVNGEYCKSVLDRESILSTDIGKLIAIPHGKSDLILKNTIVIASLKQPIVWNKNMVQLVFMIVMNMDNPNETKAVLNDLYKIIDSDDLANALRTRLDFFMTKGLKI